MKRILSVVLTFILLLHESNPANVIIFTAMFSTKGSTNIFWAIANALAERGDTVTIVSPYRNTNLPAGIKEIVLEEAQENGESVAFSEVSGLYSSVSHIASVRDRLANLCISMLNHSAIQNILIERETFDLAIFNWDKEDCALGIVEKLQIPFIYFSTDYILSESINNLRIPPCTSSCPVFYVYNYPTKMTLLERLKNSLAMVVVTWVREAYYAVAIDKVLQNALGKQLPSVLDIERNVSLLVINDHFSMSYARPLLPNIIQVPCIHCRAAQPLSKELERWIDGSGEHGFIYFSLGTYVPAHKMPKPYLEAFTQVFSKLKQRILWKINLQHIDHLPSNVKLCKWADQQDILGHPKLQLFITHGGQLSVMEATYHGVPMLGLPVTTDQPYNLRFAEDAGTAIRMKWEDVTSANLQKNIIKLLFDSRYRKSSKKRKELFRDLDQPPLQKMLYWIDYVIKYKGAPQLRSEALNQTWYQYYQMDLQVLLLGLLVCFLFVVCCVYKFFMHLLRRKRRKTQKKCD